MKRIIVFVVLLAVVALPLGAQEPKKKDGKRAVTATAQRTAAEPSKELMQKILEAWETMDPAKAAPYYSKFPENVFYDVAPLKYVGWQQYAEGSKALLATLQSIKFKLNDDVQVHRFGNIAFGTATARSDLLHKDGSKEGVDTRWTVIWEKQGNSWLVVHEHYSAPLPEQPPKK